MTACARYKWWAEMPEDWGQQVAGRRRHIHCAACPEWNDLSLVAGVLYCKWHKLEVLRRDR